MSEQLNSLGAITLFVEDPQRSKAFYSSALTAPIVFEDANSVVVGLENPLVNLLAASEAPGLIEPGVVAPPGTGSRFQLTIWVEDADAVCAQLAENGIELLNGPLDRPWGVRTAAFADPDGHIWEIAQQLGDG